MVEIRSPGDETYEKFDFYARLGTPEIWVIDRDSRQGDIYLLSHGRYHQQPPDGDGWQMSPTTGVRMRPHEGRLALQNESDETTRQSIP